MTALQYQILELFQNLSSNAPTKKSSVSDHGSTTVEIFVDDKQSLKPDFWGPEFLAPVINARLAFIEGRVIVLCGFSKPNDPVGNLMLFRVHPDPAKFCQDSKSRDEFCNVMRSIVQCLRDLGVRFDRNMADFLKRS
jgi:hypothetical protein